MRVHILKVLHKSIIYQKIKPYVIQVEPHPPSLESLLL